MRLYVVLVIVLAIVACRPRTQPAPGPEPDELGSACEAVEFEDTPFTVCTADPGRHEIRLVPDGADGEPVREFERLGPALGPDAARLSFAMNAGMFDDRGAPIGLAIAGGETRHALNRKKGEGNFHLLPNGVFFGEADGGWRVLMADDYARLSPSPAFATQSGPMLVIDRRAPPALRPERRLALSEERRRSGRRRPRAFRDQRPGGLLRPLRPAVPRPTEMRERSVPRRVGVATVGRAWRTAGHRLARRPVACGARPREAAAR